MDIHEDGLDEAQMATWVRQAAALPGWVPWDRQGSVARRRRRRSALGRVDRAHDAHRVPARDLRPEDRRALLEAWRLEIGVERATPGVVRVDRLRLLGLPSGVWLYKEMKRYGIE